MILICLIWYNSANALLQSNSPGKLNEPENYRQNVEVIRDNRQITIDAANLVPGNIVVFSEGDRIPADGRLIAGNDVRLGKLNLLS